MHGTVCRLLCSFHRSVLVFRINNQNHIWSDENFPIQEALSLRNRASAMHFFVAKLFSIAVIA